MPGEGRATGNTPAVTAVKIGYARVSTDGQDLTAQRQPLAALGVQPDRVYVDHGITGTHRQRPGLREALAACRTGDSLVVTKLDPARPLRPPTPATSSTSSPPAACAWTWAVPCTTPPTRSAGCCSPCCR